MSSSDLGPVTASLSSLALAPVLTPLEVSIANLTASVAVLQKELDGMKGKRDLWSNKCDEEALSGSVSTATQSAYDRHSGNVEKAQAALDKEKKLLVEEKKLQMAEKQLAAQTVRPASLKMLRRLDAQSKGIGEFLFYEFGNSYVQIFAEPQGFAEFNGKRLFGDSATPTRLIIRKCYRVMADFAQRALFEADPGLNVLVAGTRGIGKSAFGLLMALKWAEEGHPVLYEHKGQYFLVLRETVKQELLGEINKWMTSAGYCALEAPGVFSFSGGDVDLFSHFSQWSDFVHVQDLGDNQDARMQRSGTSKKLLLSSPNNTNLESLKRATSIRVVVMPLWSEDELQFARDSCFENISKDDVAPRFKLFGGVPRMVLEFDFQTAEALLNSQVKSLSVQDLHEVMAKYSYMDLPPQRQTSVLIHVWPKGEVGEFECQFASDTVSRRLAEKFLLNSDLAFQNFASQASHLPAFAAWRGYMLEALTHRVLGGHEKVPVKLLKLDPKTNPVKESTIEFGFGEIVRFDNLAKITIKANTYYQPTASNYPTIDSFAVMDKASALKHFPSTKVTKMEHFVVFFQVTVSPKHGMSGTVLKEHLDKVKKDLPSESVGMIIVFVTSETNGITRSMVATHLVADSSAEAVKARAGGIKAAQVPKPFADQAPFSRQFAMYIGPKFESVMEQWKDAPITANPAPEVEEEEEFVGI
ncbi:hypothetical protein BASA62_002769 [Batrachochytrium salamandrivorans]|nr:hypothetical protein BASA62_002769 [Batrachochytrium salamandrivorans]